MHSYCPKTEAKKLLSARRITFPVPVVDIARSLGLSVVADSSYRENGHGHTQSDNEGSFTIVVNTEQCAERKRFTIAHEIGHFIMDRDYIDQHQVIDRDGNAADPSYRSRERRANEFAAELLMPEEEFIEQWLSLNSDVFRVADYFAVSRQSAKWRAINLGITEAD